MPDDHHLPEIVRRLEDVVSELREMRSKLETTYVRLDVWEARRSGDRAEVREMRTDLDSIAAQRRQMLTLAVSGLLLPIISGLVIALILAGRTA